MTLVALQRVIQGQDVEASFAEEELGFFRVTQRIKVRFVEVLTGQVIRDCGVDGINAVVVGADATGDDR